MALKYPKAEVMAKKLDEFAEQRSPYERRWDVNRLMVRGFQHSERDISTGRYIAGQDQLQQVSRATEPQINHLLDLVRTVRALMRTQTPGMGVMPATPHTDDIVKAKSAQMLLDWQWQRIRWDRLNEKSVNWMTTTGMASQYVIVDGNGNKIATKVAAPYDTYAEPGISDWGASMWKAVRTFVHPAVLKQMFKGNRALVDESSETEQNDNSLEPRSQPKGRREVFRVWWRDGKQALLLGDQYLWTADESFVKKAPKVMPIQHCFWSREEEVLWPEALIDPAVSIQYYRNALYGQIFAWIALTTAPRWLVPKGSGVRNDAFLPIPGERIDYNAAMGKPSMMQLTPLPAEAFALADRLAAEIETTTGVHGITKGRKQAGVNSSVAMRELFERDTTHIALSMESMKDMLEDLCQVSLIYMQRFWKKDKVIRALDLAGSPVYRSIKQADFEEDPEVFFEADTLFRADAVARQQTIIAMLQMGAIEPQRAVEAMSMKIGDLAGMKRLEQLAEARRILDGAKAGHHVEIFSTDSQEAFLAVFDEYIKSADYREDHPLIQQYIRDIFLAIQDWGMPEEVHQQNTFQTHMFPRTPLPTRDATKMASAVALPSTAAAQAQTLDDGRMKARKAESIMGAAGSLQAQPPALNPLVGGGR